MERNKINKTIVFKMQKLTDIWQNLVRWHDPPNNQEAVNQHSQIDEQDNQQSDHHEQTNLE